MKKLDIMNMRKGEEWILVNGKEVRIEKAIIVEDTVVKEVVKDIKKTEVKKVVKKVVKNGK